MSFDLGDPVPLRFLITDPNGNPANAGTVTLTITQPDNTAAGPFTLVAGALGTYDYDYTPTQVGRHLARCVATGANASAYSDAFDVDPADLGGILSLAETKTSLNITNSKSDELIRGYIAVATALIEDVIGPVIPTSHTETVQATDTIVLAKAPVLSITSIASTFPLSGGPISLTPMYLLDPLSGVLRQNRSQYGPDPAFAWGGYDPFFAVYGGGAGYGAAGFLTVMYVAGRPIVPPLARQAAHIIVNSLMQTQRGSSPMPVQGGEQASGPPEIMPPEAVELLAPLRRIGAGIA